MGDAHIQVRGDGMQKQRRRDYEAIGHGSAVASLRLALKQATDLEKEEVGESRK
jgi:hypothetical protein